DAAAVLFPLGEDANPFTMGDDRNPVNAWFWKADREEPFDVIARGYSTSQRRPGGASGLVARAEHRQDAWVGVFQRPLRPAPGEFTHFEPGATARIAFAVWEGSNAERGGQKAVSGAFLDLEFDG
ncbi:MAG: ethylbenzene dehydrogenase-related protein, partial [Deltaproteobacteria bacterium]|nr:ethylbenzene dehydrogenase-related protein [Deltaproteobacteria bacterium]